MVIEKEQALDAFLTDVEELRALLDTWGQLEAKAKSMAPYYTPTANGFMALPRLRYEVGVMLDGLVHDILDEDGNGVDVDMIRNDVQDLLDVLEVAKSPRMTVTA